MIPLSVPEISGNEWKYIKECLDTGWVSSVGSYVDLFELRFKEYVGSGCAVVTMNGTAAITLALQTLGIGQGDEVIVPSMTFIASVNPIKYVGAEPVFVDVDPDTWVMDVNKVSELITDKTKAILPVHTYGNVVDMEPLIDIAKKNNLYIIEDATEALGSEYMTSDGKWHKAGTLGDFGTFSFNGNKLITTGAGGMLVTNNEALGEKAKHLSTQAKRVTENHAFMHDAIGYNYRMPNLLAAIGVAQLERVNEFIAQKLEHAMLYDKLLKDLNGIKLPSSRNNVRNVYWLYSVLVEDNYRINRDELIKEFDDNKIQARPFFQPIHEMKPYIDSSFGDMSITKYVSDRGINLPSSVSITKEQILNVVEVIKKYLENKFKEAK